MKALNIIETAYRATLEEQDDPVVWITHAMKGAGADLNVLLRGNAVNYAVKAQGVAPLEIGGREQKNAPRIAEDVSGLIGKGVAVYIVKEDLAARGLEDEELIDGLNPISSAEVPGLLENYDHVWHW
jgi:sulfur transfer complex TusBCD TusB component (DsrH family)